jgi:hypothetical protein
VGRNKPARKGGKPPQERATLSPRHDQAWLQKCDDEYSGAYDAIQKNQEEYDKQLITLSAAFLTLTISFINNIVPIKEADFRGLLYTSLILISACLLSVLVSYQVSIFFHYEVADFWRESKDGDAAPTFPMIGAAIVRGWNVANGLMFAIGVGFIVAFVVTNIHTQAKEKQSMAKSSYATDGMPLKIPSHVERGQNIKIPISQSAPGTSKPQSQGEVATVPVGAANQRPSK